MNTPLPERSLAGKAMVITGATSGIGLAAAKALCAQGASVIGVGRSAERCAAAEEAIRAQTPRADITFLLADLSSQQQVRDLAECIRSGLEARHGGRLDVLINNAGAVANWFTATEDGYELQFAVNHLAPFLLTLLLLPELHAAPAARVITTSSNSHRAGRIHWKDVMLHRGYHTLRAYEQSKLANVLFTAEFNRRKPAGEAVRAYAVDPGLVNTDIGLKGTHGLVHWFWKKRSAGGATPEQGASTIVHLASEPELKDPVAVFWKKCRPCRPSRRSRREDDARRLWELSERLCGLS